MKKIFLLFLASILSTYLFAQQQIILTGRVTNVLGDPIPFVTVYIKGTTQGGSTNTNGDYYIMLSPGKYQINYRVIGYKQLTDNVEINGKGVDHTVKLSREVYQLKQPDDTGSSDAAISIIRNAIEKRQQHLNEVSAYRCNVYLRGTQRLISAPKSILSRNVARQLQLNLNSNTILYMYEAGSQLSFKQPDKYHEVMMSSKVIGGYNVFNFTKAQNLQVNFYKNMLGIEGLNARGFISPIADNALTFYTYKLIGTAIEDGKTIDKIQVTPIDARQPVFNGNIYIIDGEWRIYSAHLYVAGKTNLNFVDTLNINQQYIPIDRDVWLPAEVSLTYSGDVLGFKYDGYILGTFNNYNLNPKFSQHYFNGETVRITDTTARRDSAYWSQHRAAPLTIAEQKDFNHKDSILKKQETTVFIDSAEKANNHFNPLSYTFFGDTIKNRYKHEIFTINPLYDAVQYNTVEGWVIDLKPAYSKQLGAGKQYTISPELRFGFDNKIISFNTKLNYVYDPNNQGTYYAKIGSGIYNLNNEGSVGTLLNGINSLFFKDNELKLYQSKNVMAGTQREVSRGLLLDVSLDYAVRDALQNTSNRTVGKFPDKEFTSNNPYVPTPALSAPLLFQESNALTLKLAATYTFNETYTTTPTGRILDESPFPKLKLNYRKGIKGLVGSDVDYDYADVQLFQNHIDLGIYGYSAFLVTAGNFFNSKQLSFPDYKWFQGNQGITFEPGISEFHFLPYYYFSQTSFIEAHYEHNFAGYLFNNIQGLRKLKLEEIVGGNFLVQQDQPNYAEFYIGVQRFFLRFDYGFVYRGDGHFNQGIKIYFGL